MRTFCLNNYLEILLVFLCAVGITSIDILLSFKYGWLSQPFVYDGIAYCNKAKELFNTFHSAGIIEMLAECFSMREPFWDFCIAVSYILFNSTLDWVAATARIFPVFVILFTIYFTIRKHANFSIAVFILIVSLTLPIIAPNIRLILPLGEAKVSYLLADLRPDFLWGAMLFSTCVFVIENYTRNTLSFYFLAGVMAGLTVLSKGSMAPVSFFAFGLCSLYVLFKQWKEIGFNFITKIFITPSITAFFIGLWWQFGGLKSNIGRIFNVLSNDQMIRKGWTYSEKLLNYFRFFENQIGFTELRLSVLLVIGGIVFMIIKKKLFENVLVYFLLSFFIILVMSINGPNPLKGIGVSLLFYLSALLVFCELLVSRQGKWKFSLKTSLSAIGIIIIIGWIGLIAYANDYYKTQLSVIYNEHGQIGSTKEEYLKMIKEVDGYIDDSDKIFHNFYLFAGNEGMNRYLGRNFKSVWMNITQDKDVFLKEMFKSDVFLIDSEDSPVFIHKQRRKHFKILSEFLDNSDDYQLVKKYEIPIYKNSGNILGRIRFQKRSIHFYKKNNS